MEKTVIEIENLSKLYRLGVIGATTLQESFQRWWYRRRGNVEMLQKIGAKHRMIEPDDPQAGPEPNTIWALKDVSFSVQKGEVIGIIGKNGAGKSTLLKILTRITEPTSGRAIIHGRVASLLEVGTGFHPELTGRENVYLNGAILGMHKSEIKRKFDEIVEFSGIGIFIDTPVKRYSSGMYVRLAFAVAAHLEPDILLVDEVLAVGDLEFQKKCIGKMKSVAEGGRTVLFVSHNMNSVNRLCSRSILLTDGRIAKTGLTLDITRHYINLFKKNENKANTITTSQEDPRKEHQVLAVSIHYSDGKLVNRPLEVNEKFLLRIKYLLKKPLPGCYFTFMIHDGNNDYVLFSDNRDNPQSFTLGKNKRNLNVEIEIPNPLLVPGEYFISASIGHQSQGGVDAIHHAISFEIVDTLGLRKWREGHIYVPLEWTEVS